MQHWSGEVSKGPDDWYLSTFSCLDQKDVRLLTREDFVPRGGTALVDAVCKAIDDTGSRLRLTPEHLRPSKVLFVIMTDGQENSSSVYAARYMRDNPGFMGNPNTQALHDRVKHQKDTYAWEFLFLGANQDAIETGSLYGIKSALTYAHTPSGTDTCFQSTSKATRSWKLDGNQSAANLFTDPGTSPQLDADGKPIVQVDVTINNSK